MSELGRFLRETRERKRTSGEPEAARRFCLKAVAERAGLSLGYLSELERGVERSALPIGRLYSLASALEIEVEALLIRQRETSLADDWSQLQNIRALAWKLSHDELLSAISVLNDVLARRFGDGTAKR